MTPNDTDVQLARLTPSRFAALSRIDLTSARVPIWLAVAFALITAIVVASTQDITTLAGRMTFGSMTVIAAIFGGIAGLIVGLIVGLIAESRRAPAARKVQDPAFLALIDPESPEPSREAAIATIVALADRPQTNLQILALVERFANVGAWREMCRALIDPTALGSYSRKRFGANMIQASSPTGRHVFAAVQLCQPNATRISEAFWSDATKHSTAPILASQLDDCVTVMDLLATQRESFRVFSSLVQFGAVAERDVCDLAAASVAVAGMLEPHPGAARVFDTLMADDPHTPTAPLLLARVAVDLVT